MTQFEKSALIGYWRNGMTFEMIAAIMGISEHYARQIVNDYLKTKK
jgi:DNA-directed RNA polymerase specialized sigma subunit